MVTAEAEPSKDRLIHFPPGRFDNRIGFGVHQVDGALPIQPPVFRDKPKGDLPEGALLFPDLFENLRDDWLWLTVAELERGIAIHIAKRHRENLSLPFPARGGQRRVFSPASRSFMDLLACQRRPFVHETSSKDGIFIR